MKKLLVLLFLLPFALVAQKVNGVYTRAELTAQRPLQCSACLVQEGDSVWLFVRKNGSTAVAGPDVIVTTFGSIKLHKAKLAGAINFANANYYSKAELNPLLGAKVGIATIGSNQLAYYDASNKSIYGSNVFQANGKIGINTTNPEEQLHVNGNVKFRSIKSWARMDIEGQQLGGDINQNLSGITFGHWLSSGGGYILGAGGGRVGDWNYDDPYIYLQGNKGVVIASGSDNFGNTAGIFVDTLRRVGIRRTSPTYALDVAGTMRSDSGAVFAEVSGGVGIGTAAIEKLTVGGNIRSTNGAISSFKSGSNSLSNQFYFANPANSRAYNWQLNGDETAADFYGFLDGVGWGRLMTITATGRVGIGTASPAANLHVNGTMILAPVSAATASGYTPVEGQIVIVNTTDATFTSLGLWSYANGAWRK
ncbi:hypothetical protein DR864_28130 [Runella rosea]|uniref:T9SS C-terminal target domain-containing protein n=1 Tax=Runella rosea TaxID=2259595 RepID=A0A344TRR2_9BACT|nr:hypothetical protein [Runella rosea]AXE16266.1 hypothetical protein DR864_00265 [Runella rosea]AXE21333.1 hypothetical protein DR864_28130 [Runella rosea]